MKIHSISRPISQIKQTAFRNEYLSLLIELIFKMLSLRDEKCLIVMGRAMRTCWGGFVSKNLTDVKEI